MICAYILNETIIAFHQFITCLKWFFFIFLNLFLISIYQNNLKIYIKKLFKEKNYFLKIHDASIKANTPNGMWENTILPYLQTLLI